MQNLILKMEYCFTVVVGKKWKIKKYNKKFDNSQTKNKSNKVINYYGLAEQTGLFLEIFVKIL